jgi:hypothetical protein
VSCNVVEASTWSPAIVAAAVRLSVPV